MAARRTSTRKRTRRVPTAATGLEGLVVYIHGIGAQRPKSELKLQWDLALFGKDMGSRTRMAFWADVFHPGPAPEVAGAFKPSAMHAQGLNADRILEDVGVADNPEARELAFGLLGTFGVTSGQGPRAKVIPLPGFLRKPIAKMFLEALVKDTAGYFFKKGKREEIQQRLLDQLPPAGTPITLVSHSMGTVISLEVLHALKGKANVEQYVTLGSPLGIREVQDFLECKLDVPNRVLRWNNFADPLDPVALDKGLSGDYDPAGFIKDEIIFNTQVRRLEGFNPHASAGYLAHPKVRRVVCDAIRFDTHARFVVARDVAETLAVSERQPVLIEILEPCFPALDESRKAMALHEAKVEHGATSLAERVTNAAAVLERLVGKQNLDAAAIDPLKRFVAARLTPTELTAVAQRHKDLRVYAIWKSVRRRKLLRRSCRVVQADAARRSYSATGQGVTWAVLDTGVRRDHPHFRECGNIAEVWDCTKRGAPVKLPDDRDRDGHGTHVSGIIAGSGSFVDPSGTRHIVEGIAPHARLIVYKVLNDAGEGEDAWIIKALDHIATTNESAAEIVIHGVNLSLGGPFDSTVYGCGFSPICVELRRLWRSGVLVCVACGNEGQVEVNTPDGEVELNSPMSIGDPANLEDCIAVGSVNADRPHLYGVSSFSSHGPTSDGRVKPDVVAPGERILSCNSRFRSADANTLYREESGTSMAAPHVSGLLAAFLSVRKEFRGRPDEVKAILRRTCIDIGRDRYHQGAGVPNLMQMLLEA